MHVLVVDDEKNIRRAFTIALESIGHEVKCAANSAAALAELQAGAFDVVLLDLRLSQESGLDLLEEIHRLSPQTAVVIVTAYAAVETAVEAMRRGAFDYLPKPCTAQEMRQVLERVAKTKALERRVAELESRLDQDGPEFDLFTQAPAMQKALDVAFRAADSEATILLLGESGAGKSVLARALHQRSRRKSGAFVTVSCPSLSRELLESDLFGHVKGAFTGAHVDTQGKVAAADGGTLFLDEIGELPLEIQAKLLRLLQEREYERVGEAKTRRANVRIISATNRDLAEAVAEARFREDLFYRLNVISVRVPGLRERVKDIERLAQGHLEFLAARSGKQSRSFSPAAIEAMRAYHWPGNLRELRNVIERAVILCTGEQIEPADLGEAMQAASEIRLGAKVSLEEIQAEHIRRVIANTRTLEEAAGILGIDPATLYRRRKKGLLE
jgi:NtrC-family two-component system response regulator AlgB